MEVNRKCLSSQWGIRSVDWISSPAEGSAGGLLIGWKMELFEVQQIQYGIFSLSVKFRNKKEGFHWCLSCIYGPSVYSNKNELWIDLNDLGNLIHGCVGADFNEILYSMG